MNEVYAKTSDDIDLFISENRDLLEKTEFSHSFSPEQLEYVESFEEFRNTKKLSSIVALDFLTNKLNIKNIRIGIRWNTVDLENKIDLSKYKEIINYCLENKLEICLNIGPIKTFRWPEIYVPEKILPHDEQFHEVFSNSEMSIKSIEYLERLFAEFEKEFGQDFFQKIATVQPDNELFNPFGPREWIVSVSHEINVIKKIREYFPNSKILISLSGGPNRFNILKPDYIKAIELVKKLTDFIPTKDIIIGNNYYYKIPGFPQNTDGLMIDNFTYLKIVNGKNVFQKLTDLHKFNQIGLEISELQFENWGEVVSPGNSLRELQFALLRTLHDLDAENYSGKIVIRLWGSELFAKRYLTKTKDAEIQKIYEFITKLSSPKSS